MTNRERIINTVLGRDTDRAPFILYFGPWAETLKKWHEEEGVDPQIDIAETLGYDKGFYCISEVNLGLCPAFPEELIEDRENTIVLRNFQGILMEIRKDGDSIPNYLAYPVKNMDDWQRLKTERLNPYDPRRFPKDWNTVAQKYNGGDYVVQLGDYPYGLFGTARDLMGVENLLISFYEQPELIKDIMDYLTDFWITIYEEVCRHIKVDCIHIWEDMSGKQGSLISPKMIREFMLPNYKKIKAFADAHDIPILSLDTDGNCDELIPLFMESGINMMLPFEVAAGCDVVRYRKLYPTMCLLGGIDKREIARGEDAIEQELKRIEPLLDQSGYIPALDHLIQPEISWEIFCYFSARLRYYIEKHARRL